MQVGTIIRKCRKDKNLTQEEMAKRIGVSAPAVNKWENGYSLPDISLLSPIARLLDISIDTLLSHQKELSNIEADCFIEQINRKLKEEPFDEVFQWVKQCFMEYPNCDYLILWMARILDSQRQGRELPNEEKYDTFILDSYKRVLESKDTGMQEGAAEALYYFYMSKEEYEQAEKCLTYFSQDNPERKRKQAMICSKTGREEEAYKAYEEILYAGYQNQNMNFYHIYMLALEEKNYDKAHMLVDKMQKLANLFEFGEYHEVSPGIELAIREKNETKTLQIVESMLTNLESISAFTKSPLYSHMNFKEISREQLTEIRKDLMKGFCDEETYAYLKESPRWRALVGLPGK